MVVLLTTSEGFGIDRYSRELSKRIRVPTLESRRYLSLKDSFALLRRLKQDPYIVHFPSQHFARCGLFLGKPFIITVHDLARICFPFAKETLLEKIGLKLDALGLRRAEHIITVSACTKADLVHYLNIPKNKISVIYNGVDRQVFKPLSRKRCDFSYLLYVGSERPRKNLGTLLEAFAILKRESSALRDVKLVKVGSAGRTEEFRRATLGEVRHLGLENEVIFVDHISSDEELAGYYSSAMGLIMPSLYEGFGLPLIEAMACGCPVITSNSSSLPEVAGNAALFFTPHDGLELAHLIHRLITEPVLRDELIRKGFERVERFSCEKAACETLQVYRGVEAELGSRQRRREADGNLAAGVGRVERAPSLSKPPTVGESWAPVECFRCGVRCTRYRPRVTPEEGGTY